jgi:electron transport complex protein RnfG
MKHILKPALALFIITAIATALLGFARDFTQEARDSQRQKTQERAMKEVLPHAVTFREFQITPSGSGSIQRIFEGVRDGSVVGYVVELSPVGYADKINMVVGISTAHYLVSGMRILRHSETPGLGALATQERFYTKFNGRRLSPLNVVKIPTGSDDEIEAITASTITTRAVTNAVNEAIEWFNSEVRR